MPEQEQITFDEVDLNYLREAVGHQIAHTDWDVTNNDDWEILKSLKALEDKLNRALDACYDARTEVNNERR
jgi:hypothetical protein